MTTRVEFREYVSNEVLCTCHVACVPVVGESVWLNGKEFYVFCREHKFSDESGAWNQGYVVIALRSVD